MIITFRPYQIEILSKIDDAINTGYSKILISSAVSSGKTIIMARVIAALKPYTCLVIVPATELKEQVEKDLNGFGLVNFEVETIQKMIIGNPLDVDLLLLDEAHRYASDVWGQITKVISSKNTLGFSGTVFRTDHRPLLKANGGYFEHLIEGPTLSELTNMGYAAQIQYHTSPIIQRVRYIPVISKITGEQFASYKSVETEPMDLSEDIVNQYVENFYGIPTLAFCRNIKHSKSIADDFKDVGISAVSITGDNSKRECSYYVDQFRGGKIKVLSICRKLNEGVSIPEAKVAIFMRNYYSLVNYIQATGRIVRNYESQIAHMVDLVGNVYRFGHIEEAEVQGKLITV